MLSDVCIAMVYDKNNRYSVNALIAAVESRNPSVRVTRIPLYKSFDVVQQIIDLNKYCKRIIVGFSFMTPQLLIVKDIAKLIKTYVPKALLVAGGPHASGDPLGTLTKLDFDVVLYGEGEDIINDLIKSYGDTGEYRICGSAYLDSDKVYIRKRMKVVDLDSYPPFPYWRGVVNPIEIMRGCSSACFFCQVTYTFGKPRYRGIETIAEYAKISIEKGLRDLRFIAPNSLGYGSSNGIKPNHEMLYSLLSKLHSLTREHGGRIFFGTFPSEIRPDSVDVESANILRRFANNRRVIIGAQSGSNKILRMIHRGHNVEDVENAIDILSERGFAIDIDLIFGFPFEDENDFEETLAFMKRVENKNVRFHLHTFIPLPGTPFSDLETKLLSHERKTLLAKFIGKGKAYGYWIEQEKISAIIKWLKQNKIIYSLHENFKRSRISVC
ncbi:MAG: TIGR04013 family B12-binding domain/radical SAM domain-containing protein [Ignisphaera sp.]